MNNFKTGQLCKIVDDAFHSNLPDDKVTHGGVLVSQIPLSIFKLKAIPEGTPVLVVNVFLCFFKYNLWSTKKIEYFLEGG